MATSYPRIPGWVGEQAGRGWDWSLPRNIRTLHEVAWVRLALNVGFVLLVFGITERWLVRVTRLPESAFERPTLLFETAGRLFSPDVFSVFSLLVLASGFVVAIRFRTFGPVWKDLEYGRSLRALILVVACVLAWAYSTYDYNLYFDQGHDLDRFLLILMVPLVYFRLLFVFPFLFILLPVIQQFNHPIGGYSVAEPFLLVRVLILMGTVFLMTTITRRSWSTEFLFLFFCLVAASFWVSGYGKLLLNWIVLDRIYYLIPATYANGWLGFLQPESIDILTRQFSLFNVPLKAITLVAECGALFCLRKRTWLKGFFVLWVTLHAGIFFTTGICFWQWMLLQLAVLFLFLRKSRPELPLFNRPYFWLSLVVIGTGAFWARPAQLSWIDSPISYTYRFKAQSESGRWITLTPRFFAPYDYQFTLTGFHYLAPNPNLEIWWGATRRRAVARRFPGLTTPGSAMALEAHLGKQTYDPHRSAVFDRFIRRVIHHYNLRGTKSSGWSLLQAPRQLWTFPATNALVRDEPLKRVVVDQVTTFFDGMHYREIRTLRVRSIDVDSVGG